MTTSQSEVPTRCLLHEQEREISQSLKREKKEWELECENTIKRQLEQIKPKRVKDAQLVSRVQEKAKLPNQTKDNSKKPQPFIFGEFVVGCSNHSELPDDRIQAFLSMNELEKISKKQQKLRRQSRHILCKLASIIILTCLFFITLLKVFLFFSSQFITTVIQSFKQQLFNPKITNDELQMEIFYIEEACFLLTTVLLFLFVLFCTLMTKKYYVASVGVYRRNCRVVSSLERRQGEIRRKWARDEENGLLDG